MHKEQSSMNHLINCVDENDDCLSECNAKIFEECFAQCKLSMADCLNKKESILEVIRCARTKREECKQKKCHMKKSKLRGKPMKTAYNKML